MAPLARRALIVAFGILFFIYTLRSFTGKSDSLLPKSPGTALPTKEEDLTLQVLDNDPSFTWEKRPQTFPPPDLTHLPSGAAARIGSIQFNFQAELNEQKAKREQRLAAIKEALAHSWRGYREHAWGADEVTPLTGLANSKFGDWGATLVDTLDTLWIMGMRNEFEEAVAEVDKIDFTKCEIFSINVFETTIRYLGGFLSAYDLSKNPVLLKKAKELGHMLYAAFDTKNRMPITRWDWFAAMHGENDAPASTVLLAEVASLSLEFTHLSQITGDPKYYDAVARIAVIMNKQQNSTYLPGLWPVMVHPSEDHFDTDSAFTLGGMADSAFEYLPKEWLLLAGRDDMYKTMYQTALVAIKRFLAYQPYAPPDSYKDILSSGAAPLLLGTVRAAGRAKDVMLTPEGQHLTCFAGGMVALGARLFPSDNGTQEDLDFAERLVAGCIWSYFQTESGVGPEKWSSNACRQGMDAVTNGAEADWKGNKGDCAWDRDEWLQTVRMGAAQSKDPKVIEEYVAAHFVPEGMTYVSDPRYLLRPEAIESVFILYRITGDERLREHAWRMWESIHKLARTKLAYAQVENVLDIEPEVKLDDSMESFWTAETLKYFYLIFAEPTLISLDEWVFNTEAHPFKLGV